MKLCRYNDDRLGLVINSNVHDVTPLQNEIIKASRYAMQGDDHGAGNCRYSLAGCAAVSAGGKAFQGDGGAGKL